MNPKVALFVLAFFPQFIKREYISSPAPFVFLGITYAIWFNLAINIDFIRICFFKKAK